MATLHVRDVPEELYARLREQARGSRRSIGAAAIDILESELHERKQIPVGELLSRARRLRSRAAASAATSVADEIRADRER